MRAFHLNKGKYISSVLVILFSTTVLYAFSTGITGRTLKNGTGCDCHSANPSAGVIVTITGLSTVVPGTSNIYTVTITGGPLAAGGTNIASSGGTLAPTGTDLQLIGDELTQTLPKPAASGSVTFQFNFTAPVSEGVVTLYANGNSVNSNGANSGDQWNFAPNFSINVSNPTDVKDDNLINTFALKQNYPNPFNPSTNINFSLPQSGNVKLNVYDALGNVVTNLFDGNLSEGEHQITFNSNGRLSSGIYYYKIEFNSGSEAYSETKKMILLQ